MHRPIMVRVLPLLLLLIAAPALAVEPGVVSLSPAERLAAIDSGDEHAGDAAFGGGTDGRKVHGEVGMMIGTNGTRGVYGVTAIPLGETGTAVIGFESSRYGYNRRR